LRQTFNKVASLMLSASRYMYNIEDKSFQCELHSGFSLDPSFISILPVSVSVSHHKKLLFKTIVKNSDEKSIIMADAAQCYCSVSVGYFEIVSVTSFPDYLCFCRCAAQPIDT
jgi:hypothetical protein